MYQFRRPNMNGEGYLFLKWKIFKIILILTLFWTSAVHAQSDYDEHNDNHSSFTTRALLIPSFCRLNDEFCCEDTFNHFKLNWDSGELPLSGLLENFRQANCTQFATECEKRTFAHTKFTRLLYDRFCDEETFQLTCSNDVASVEDRSVNNGIPNACQQVLMYNSSNRDYLEIITYYSPFCGLVWCGLDVSTAQALQASTWTCLKTNCQIRIVALMVVCAILALITVVINFTVLCVLWRYKKVGQNSQILYKFSLALADLVVGLVVFPSCVSTMYFRLVAQREIIFVKSEGSLNKKYAVFGNLITVQYLSAIGFFTTLSLAVSIFTLALAGFDRFQAIRDPLGYNKLKAAQRAKWLLAVVWLLCFVIAILPLFTPGLYPYSFIAGLLAATKEENAMFEYVIGLGVPFLAVWITIGAIYCTIKRQGKITKTLSHNSSIAAKKERRVHKTLFMMLSAFTLSLAPTILALFAQLNPRIREEEADLYDPELAASWSHFETFAVLLLMCNSLWNFFIYSYRDAKFRRMAKDKYSIIWRFFCWRKNHYSTSPKKNHYKTTVFGTKVGSSKTEAKTENKMRFRQRIWSIFSNNSDF